LLAAGVIITTLAWFPSFALWPFDNPNFAMMFFIASLSACVAVLSGHRKWWPVLAVTASIAAQAYLTFAVASAGLVLVAVIVGLADESRAKGGYSWLIAGLVAGVACWSAPLVQQFTNAGGQGNMSRLLHDNAGQHAGFGFALKAMASLATPSPLWWSQDISVRRNLWHLLGSTPVAFGLVTLAVTAASLVVAVWWVRSRELVGLAATSLLVSVVVAATFALIPARAVGLAADRAANTVGVDVPLIFAMFAAVLLAWLTVICVIAGTAVRLISDRHGTAGAAEGQPPGAQQRARQRLISLSVRGAAALLFAVAVTFAVRQVAGYAGSGTGSLRVSVALGMIERSLPKQRVIALSIFSTRHDRYSMNLGMCWALIANGYFIHKVQTGLDRPIPEVAVVLHGRGMTVRIRKPVARQGRLAAFLCR